MRTVRLHIHLAVSCSPTCSHTDYLSIQSDISLSCDLSKPIRNAKTRHMRITRSRGNHSNADDCHRFNPRYNRYMSELLTSIASIDPVALRLGPFSVHWYGLAYIFGIMLGVTLGYLFAKRWKVDLSFDDITVVALCATIGIIAGGRLGYCLFYGGSYYWMNPLKILALTDGGMSFHGGFLGCVVGGLFAARLIKVSPLTLIDLGCVTAPIGLFLGRLTNFINEEVWGRVTTVPWGVVFSTGGPLPRHPSQLYEAFLEGIVLFAIMAFLALRVPPPPKGVLLGSFLVFYGIFRIFVEFFREPDSSLGFLAGDWLTMGMLLSIPMVLAGIGLIVWSRRQLRLGG